MHALTTALAFAGASLRSRMQYRVNFLTMVAFGLVYQTTGFVFIWAVLSRFDTIAGWTLGEVAFLYGLRLTAHGLYVTLLGGIGSLRYQIRQGMFDRYLVRPMPPLVQVLAMEVRANSFGDLLGGVTLLVAAHAIAGLEHTPAALGYLVLSLIGGMLVEAAVQLFMLSLGFRLLEVGALAFFVDDVFNNFGNYPLTIFGHLARFALTWALPVAFVAYFPSTVLLGRTDELSVSPLVAYAAPLIGILWFGAALLFFGRQMRHYQSSGH